MRPTTTQAPTGLEWAGVALLGLSTAALAGCLPAIYTLWRLFNRHGRHHRPPMYYRLAARPVRLKVKR